MEKKLKIDQLKVKSFVTSMEDETSETVKGGWTTSNPTAIPDDKSEVCCAW